MIENIGDPKSDSTTYNYMLNEHFSWYRLSNILLIWTHNAFMKGLSVVEKTLLDKRKHMCSTLLKTLSNILIYT